MNPTENQLEAQTFAKPNLTVRKMIIGSTILLLVAAGSTFAYMKSIKSDTEAKEESKVATTTFSPTATNESTLTNGTTEEEQKIVHESGTEKAYTESSPSHAVKDQNTPNVQTATNTSSTEQTDQERPSNKKEDYGILSFFNQVKPDVSTLTSAELLKIKTDDMNTFINEFNSDNDEERIISMIETNPFFQIRDDYGYQAFEFVVEFGTVKAAEIFIESGFEVDRPNSTNTTLLMLSAKNEQYETTKYLMEQGAKLDCIDNYGKSAIDYAIRVKDYNMIELLYETGKSLKMNVKNLINRKLLAKQNNTEVVDFLTQKLYLDLEEVDESGNTLLHHAITNDKHEMVNYLVAKKVNLDTENKLKKTALNLAIFDEKYELAKVLIDSGATVNESEKAEIMKLSETKSEWSSLLDTISRNEAETK